MLYLWDLLTKSVYSRSLYFEPVDFRSTVQYPAPGFDFSHLGEHAFEDAIDVGQLPSDGKCLVDLFNR